MRPSLIQNDTGPKPSSAEAPSPDLASWLTSDLRVKGTPSSPPAERPSTPHAVVVLPEGELGADQAAFGAWLTSDLRPRKSLPPDSLAPQLVPAAPALQADPDRGGPGGADLEADDFAVLPGRRGKRSAAMQHGRATLAVVLLLSALGGIWLWADRPAPSPLESIAAAQAAAPLGALPPPPPSEVPAEPLPEAEPPAAPRAARSGRPSAEPEPPPEEDAWLGPRGRNWARYADLPSPTLSRLAREERELAKKRDEQRRIDAKRAKSPE